MLNASQLVGFVATTKPEAARQFYGQTLGLPLIEDGPYALVFSANGTMVRVQKVGRVTPAGYTALGWAVADIRDVMARLAERGVAFERYEGMGQDERGVWRSPSGAAVAWFRDPDGNILSLTQYGGT